MIDFNSGYIVEGVDRCHTIMTMIDELLSEHPAIKKAKMEESLDEAFTILFNIYQAVGALEDEELSIYRNYRIFKDTVSQTYRIMLCQDNIAQDFKTSDEAKLFIDELIEVEGND